MPPPRLPRVVSGAAPSVATGIAVIGLGVAALLAFRWVGADAWSSLRSGGLVSPADVILVGVAGLGLAVTAWLVVGVLLCAVAQAPGVVGRVAHAAAERVTPMVVRQALGVALGGTVVLGAGTGFAHADGSPTAPPTTAVSSPLPSTATVATTTNGEVPDPGFTPVIRSTITVQDGAASATSAPTTTTPTTPTSSTSTSTTPATPAPRTPGSSGPTHTSPARAVDQPTRGTVVVAHGDSLWRLAARHLGPHASSRQIAAEWPRWYAANRDAIGPDPGRLRVGQVLVVPGSGS